LHGDEALFNRVADRQQFSPATLTKTWFHQGPVGEEFGEWEETDFYKEFWPGDAQMLSRSTQTQAFLKKLPRRVKRDALRTLRSSILRTELYALDGTDRQDRPYTVSESQYTVVEVLEKNGFAVLSAVPQPGDSPSRRGDDLPPRIFFPHVVAQRTTQWERGNDPMTQFTFSDDYDDFGQPLAQTQIACPRGWLRMEQIPNRPYLATRTRTVYARPTKPAIYIFDRVAATMMFELTNSGSQRVLELKEMKEQNDQLIGQNFHYYDGEAFRGAPHKVVEKFGALVRTETLVLTKKIIQEGYNSGSAGDPEQPPYLDLDHAVPLWIPEYPQAFRDSVLQFAGYDLADRNDHRARGFFCQTERRKYDFQDAAPAAGHFGLMMGARDPLGKDDGARDTRIVYDEFSLLPKRVTDPVDLSTTAEYDYRVMQPRLVTDPNDNQTEFEFSPLGLLSATWVKGKQGRNEGDQQRPSVRMEYGFLAFFNSPAEAREPIFVRTIRHCHHDTEADIALADRDKTIETHEYSDGFGRLVQTRTQAEEELFGDEIFGSDVVPADQNDLAGTKRKVVGQRNADEKNPNVVVSGWQIYDNKGQVVEKYEPFFSKGWDYRSPEKERTAFNRNVLGQKVTMFYDPRGHVIRTINPDRSEQRVIFGVPGTIAVPDLADIDFEPTPWETCTYDANDNAGRTHPAESTSYKEHWNTPASVLLDALGRTIESVERNRELRQNPGDPLAPIEEIRTKSEYDIRGNVLVVNDALGRDAFKYVYDLANQPLRIENIDAGIRRTVRDAAGNIIEQRDSKGALILRGYDVLNRPRRVWARNDADPASAMTLREQLEYGDGSNPNQPQVERPANRAANRLSRLHQHYDEAGLLTFDEYDFKGNVLEKTRQVISDEAILAVVTPQAPDWKVKPFSADWQLANAHAVLLDPTKYQITTAYDALNRVNRMFYPKDVENNRKELTPTYNRAGALEHVEMGGDVYVERIAYNAKGQRTLIAYGNGVMTRYTHDPRTSRLARLRSEKYDGDANLGYEPDGKVFQDFGYDYDLNGNILRIRDRTPESGVPPFPEQLDRDFTYDPVNRLLSAIGRESDLFPLQPSWRDEPLPQDVNRTRRYTETYRYDRVGNILRLGHTSFSQGGATGGYNRGFSFVAGTNRLRTMDIGLDSYDYGYDGDGNLTKENTERYFEWDHTDRMCAFRTQPPGAPPSLHAHYLYDPSGQRVKKLVRNQGGRVKVTVCFDGVFEHQSEGAIENDSLHVLDNNQRVALVRVGFPFPGDQTPAKKVHIGDHLGSSYVVVDSAGALVNREEYTPYGETSSGSFENKRYRFTGKQRDEETGFSYHGTRYYAMWLGRWISCDPAGPVEGPNLYFYARDNPVIRVDMSGKECSNPHCLESARAVYWDVIQKAEKVGLPVSFLRTVYAHYDIKQSDIEEAETHDFFKYIELPRAKVAGAQRDFDPASVATFYHESSHAFLDFLSGSFLGHRSQYEAFIKRSEDYYRNAPLEGGGVSKKPHLRFQEEVAWYVDRRVQAYLEALGNIERIASSASKDLWSPSKIKAQIGQARKVYEKGIIDPVGWTKDSGWLFIGDNKQTTRRMSPEIRQFINDKILEGKIPERFDEVPFIQKVLTDAGLGQFLLRPKNR
jgi:RHS repeat-associated protein